MTGMYSDRSSSDTNSSLDADASAGVFDYRHLGTSTGEPRGLIDIGRQRADYRAAVSYARGLTGVDGQRIAL